MEQDQNSLIENYIAEHTDEVSPLLQDLVKETETLTGRSRWSIGKVEGRLMQFLLKTSGARSAVEIGTFTGFSALMIAEALPVDGLLMVQIGGDIVYATSDGKFLIQGRVIDMETREDLTEGEVNARQLLGAAEGALEGLAGALMRGVLEAAPAAAAVTVRVRKLAVPLDVSMDHAEVEIHRRR